MAVYYICSIIMLFPRKETEGELVHGTSVSAWVNGVDIVCSTATMDVARKTWTHIVWKYKEHYHSEAFVSRSTDNIILNFESPETIFCLLPLQSLAVHRVWSLKLSSV